MRTRTIAASLSAALAAAAAAGPTPVAGTIVAAEGDTIDGSTIASLNSPFTNGNGQVGFVAALADGRRAIWYDTGAIFLSDNALPDDLSGGEGTMGIGNNGQFVYSPSFNGDDAVFGHNGLILAQGQHAPGYDANFFSTFNSRPQMIDDGTAYWVGGINDGNGGTSTAQRAFYRANPDGSIDRVFASGDAIAGAGGATIDFPSGVDFDYNVAGDGSHMINAFIANNDDNLVAVDGVMVAREFAATGGGDNWSNFDQMAINSSGNYLFSGDTDGATSADEFIAYNGVIAAREGMSVGGLTLGSSVNAASINNLGQAAFIWSTVETDESLFFAADAADLGAAEALLSVGDLFDDGGTTWLIDDFNASNVIGPGLDLAEDGMVYVEVDLESLDGSVNIEAVIGVAVPAPMSGSFLALGGLLATRRRRR
jgi:hypothetical protein